MTTDECREVKEVGDWEVLDEINRQMDLILRSVSDGIPMSEGEQ